MREKPLPVLWHTYYITDGRFGSYWEILMLSLCPSVTMIMFKWYLLVFWHDSLLWILSHQSLCHWRGPENSLQSSTLSVTGASSQGLDSDTMNQQMHSVEHRPLWHLYSHTERSAEEEWGVTGVVCSIMASPKHLKRVLAQEQAGYTVPETIKVRFFLSLLL